jgi:hypothetical protein
MTISLKPKDVATTWHQVIAFIGSVLGVCITAAAPLAYYIHTEIKAVTSVEVARAATNAAEIAANLDKVMVERDLAMRAERVAQLNEIRTEVLASATQLTRIEERQTRIERGIDRLVNLHIAEK